MPINIQQKHLNLIKKVLAFPDVDELLLDDNQIKDLCIQPALQKYFTKFPIKDMTTIPIGSGVEIEVPFPDNTTFGVIDARITDVGMIGGAGGSFWDIVQFQAFQSNAIRGKTGAYGQRNYNPSSLQQSTENKRHQYKSYQNAYVTNKITLDIDNKKLLVYTSNSGRLNITWAKYSEDFDNVRYERQLDVIKLCQAELLQQLVDSASILVDSGSEVTINTDALKDRAEKLFEEIETKWNEWPDIVYIHAV